MLSKRAFLVLKGNKGGSLLAACSPGASLRCRKVTFLMTAILVFSSPSLVPLLAAFISWVIWAGGERGRGARDRTALHPSTPFPQGHCPRHLPQSSIHKKTALANWEDEEEEGREEAEHQRGRAPAPLSPPWGCGRMPSACKQAQAKREHAVEAERREGRGARAHPAHCSGVWYAPVQEEKGAFALHT